MAERAQQELPGKVRQTPRREVVAERVAGTFARMKVLAVPQGVMLLNFGFFKLEQLRARNIVKSKAAQRKSVKGK